jgi:hypothetical protein
MSIQTTLEAALAVAVVAEVVKRLEGTDWHRAALKAAPAVLEMVDRDDLPAINPDGAVLIQGSSPTPYTVRKSSCTCPAGQHEKACWHVAAAVMVKAIYRSGI